MARILFLTHILPYPLDTGSKIRAYYVIRHLVQTHDVTLVSFVRPSDTPDAMEHMRGLCAELHVLPIPRSRAMDMVYLAQSLVSNQSFLVKRNWIPDMAALVEGLVSSTHFDAIHADQLAMAPYALHARRAMSGTAPLLVLDQHDAVFMMPARLGQQERNPIKRLLLQQEATKLAEYEVGICHEFDHVTWVTQQDRETVFRQAPKNCVPTTKNTVVPICVDPQTTSRVSICPSAHRITFLGGLHYPPNAQGIQWFAEEVFPQVVERVPNAVLTVIGKDPPRSILEIAARAPADTTEITGYVPDLAPFLEETAVFVVTLLAGSGMRVKILDAWRWGLPVVSTTLGAEGMLVQDGHNLLLADTAQAFAGAVVRVLQDRALADRLAANGRQTVEQHYDWRTVYRAWDEVYGTA